MKTLLISIHPLHAEWDGLELRMFLIHLISIHPLHAEWDQSMINWFEM